MVHSSVPTRLLCAAVLAAIAALLLCGCSGSDSAPASYAPPGGQPITSADLGEIAPDQIVIVLAGDASPATAKRAAQAAGGTVVGSIESAGVYQVQVTAPDAAGLEAAAEKASAVEGVAAASPHQVAWLRAGTAGTPCSIFGDDSLYSAEGGLNAENTGVERAWKIVKASGLPLAETTVGVIDKPLSGKSGEFTHLGLESAEVAGKSRLVGHGDDVVGVLAANPDNGGLIGGASVIGDKLKVKPATLDFDLKRIAARGESVPESVAADPTLATIDGGVYAVQPLVTMLEQIDDGATVINCSWGNENASPALVAAYRRFFETMAKDHPKVVFVAAAPHGGFVDGANDIPSGMKLPNVITVGSIDLDGAVGSAEAKGDGEISIVVPGGVFGRAAQKDEQGQVTGYVTDKHTPTSYAAPQVAAAAAVLKALNPELSAEDVKRILTDTAATSIKTLDGRAADVPASIGGRSLSMDAAVLEVVNGLRKAADENAAELTMADVEQMYNVTLTASEGAGGAWDVAASIAQAATGGTELTARLDGEGAIGGKTSQAAKPGATVTWSVTTGGDQATVHVKRADTGACSRVAIGRNPLVGTWRFNRKQQFMEEGWKPVVKDEVHVLTVTQGADGALTGSVRIAGKDYPAEVTLSGAEVTVRYVKIVLSGTLAGDRITGTVDQSAIWPNGAVVFDRSVGPDAGYSRNEDMSGPWKATRQ